MIGASLAGSLAAAVLAEVTGEVVLVERDRLPATPRPRAGIPHGRFPHLLLPAGARGLEALLPGITQELISSGASSALIPQDVHILTPFGWFPTFPSELRTLVCSRSLLDHHVRDRVLRDNRVTLLDRTTAKGLGIVGGRARSVIAQERGTTKAVEIPASVIVDASGRRSAAPVWLGHAGFTGCLAQRIDTRVSYAVRNYPSPAGQEPVRQVLTLQAAPPGDLTFGILVPTENGNRQAGIGAMHPCTAPRTPDEFTQALSRLRHPALAEALQGNSTSPVRTFHPGASRWNRFDRWQHWPDGLIVLGDALCTLNPVYGQGMSVAINQVLTLQQVLSAVEFECTARSDSRIYRRIRRDLARAVRPAWTISSTEDWRFPHTTGQFNPFSSLKHRVLDHLLSIGMTDPAVARHLAEVFALTRPPTSLANLDVLRAVVTYRRQSKGA